MERADTPGGRAPGAGGRSGEPWASEPLEDSSGIPLRVAALDTAGNDLRGHVFELDGREYAVLSFEMKQMPRLSGLSKAETEVVRAALAGLTNEEIAVTRGRSIFTIQNQLAAAWRKLGVSSRHEAAALLSSWADS